MALGKTSAVSTVCHFSFLLSSVPVSQEGRATITSDEPSLVELLVGGGVGRGG